MKINLVSRSAAETRKIGRILGKHLLPGTVVALKGKLGSGKTTMVKGIAKGLGVASEKIVSSPTFVLIHEYEGRGKVYHLDWYRLRSVQGPDEALAEECFTSRAVTLVEWPERSRFLIPREAIKVRLSYRGLSTRNISVSLHASMAEAFLNGLKKR
jgi:tRNA threonylcarbamoyladenosine biosynthesis protein TsaE